MTLADIKRLKQLEDENRRLKQMFANQSLEIAMLKDIIDRKKALNVFAKKELVLYAKENHQLSTRAICNSLNLSRSSYYYENLKHKILLKVIY